MFLFGSNENHVVSSGLRLHCLDTPVLSGFSRYGEMWCFLLVNKYTSIRYLSSLCLLPLKIQYIAPSSSKGTVSHPIAEIFFNLMVPPVVTQAQETVVQKLQFARRAIHHRHSMESSNSSDRYKENRLPVLVLRKHPLTLRIKK